MLRNVTITFVNLDKYVERILELINSSFFVSTTSG